MVFRTVGRSPLLLYPIDLARALVLLNERLARRVLDLECLAGLAYADAVLLSEFDDKSASFGRYRVVVVSLFILHLNYYKNC